MDAEKLIAARFARDTADHQMTVAHDHGLYRHLKFRHTGPNYASYYWFDLITVPGALIFQGDGESFTFRRTEDMFAFFRGSAWQGAPDLHYWAEKLTGRGGRNGVRTYSQDLMARLVSEHVAEVVDDGEGGTLPEYAGLADAVREQVLDELSGNESIDRRTVEQFRWWADPKAEFRRPRPPRPDFEFSDVWEWDARDYDWWFVWACHAIVWGIAQYDARDTAVPTSTPESPAPQAVDEAPRRIQMVPPSAGLPPAVAAPAVITVELPEPPDGS